MTVTVLYIKLIRKVYCCVETYGTNVASGLNPEVISGRLTDAVNALEGPPHNSYESISLSPSFKLTGMEKRRGTPT